jgi:hypothetical protein
MNKLAHPVASLHHARMSPDGLNKSPGYESALDLPSFVELLQQLQAMKLVTRFVGRAQRQQFLDIERQVRAMAATVDKFYDRLGDRHWIFHDLHMDKMTALVALDISVDELEKRFISEIYQDHEWLQFQVTRLNRLPAMRTRMELLRKAFADYEENRFYATTLVLISVMDGFVNDLDPGNRRGLHAREASELAAWDNVVGHHKGLAAAHRTFTKSFKGTSAEPIYELHRNGIVHGNLTNFDNAVVATKAWNRLFAVADWADARQKEGVPVKPKPSWRDLWQQLAENARTKKLLDAWAAKVLTSDDTGFAQHPVYRAASAFFDAWKSQKYGLMVPAIPWKTQQSYGKRLAGQLRSLYQGYQLESATIEKLDFTAPSVCVVSASLQIDGKSVGAETRWIHEQEDGDKTVIEPDVGVWRLVLWGLDAFLNQ